MTLSIREAGRLKARYGEWAVVTGASSGIGLELAKQLAGAGFNLVLNARNAGKLAETAQQLGADRNIDIIAVAADVATTAGTDKIIQATTGLNVGLFVASAGYGTSGIFTESSLNTEMEMLQVNCGGLLVLTHYYSKRFVQQKRGGIVLLSSMVAFQGVPFAANYAATKAYVQTLAEGIARELKPQGVDVLAAAPGPVASGFGKRANMKMSMSLNPADVGVPILKALGKKTTVFPGFLTKMLVYSLKTVPRWGKTRIMEKVMGGMTEHQRE